MERSHFCSFHLDCHVLSTLKKGRGGCTMFIELRAAYSAVSIARECKSAPIRPMHPSPANSVMPYPCQPYVRRTPFKLHLAQLRQTASTPAALVMLRQIWSRARKSSTETATTSSHSYSQSPVTANTGCISRYTAQPIFDSLYHARTLPPSPATARHVLPCIPAPSSASFLGTGDL